MRHLAIKKTGAIVVAQTEKRAKGKGDKFYTPCLLNGTYQNVADENLRELSPTERLSVRHQHLGS